MVGRAVGPVGHGAGKLPPASKRQLAKAEAALQCVTHHMHEDGGERLEIDGWGGKSDEKTENSAEHGTSKAGCC